MNLHAADKELLHRTCLGNESALDFLKLWSKYVHRVDDIEDTVTTAEMRLGTFALAIPIYSHPFYLKHLPELSMVAKLCTNAYADVVDWEHKGDKWQLEFADVYRHFGQEMVFAVACICAREQGRSEHEHLRSISQEWRCMSYHAHHDKSGKPT